MFQHEDFNTNPISNDIALLRLESPVEYTDNIQPVCLPGGRSEEIGSRGFVTGWGLTQEYGLISRVLQETSITVLDESHCNNNKELTICAGEIGPIVHDACQVLTFLLLKLKFD